MFSNSGQPPSNGIAPGGAKRPPARKAKRRRGLFGANVILGHHNLAAYRALQSNARVVTIHGPAGVGKTFIADQCAREGDARIDVLPGSTVTEIPDAPRVVVTAYKAPRDLGLPDSVIAQLANGVIIRHDSWPKEELAKLFEGTGIPVDARAALLEVIKTPREVQGVLATWEATEGAGDWRIRLAGVLGHSPHVLTGVAQDDTVGLVIREMAAYCGVSVNAICGMRRTHRVARARQMAMYVIRKLTPLTLKEVGAPFGSRDHSTVVYAVQHVQQRLDDRDRTTVEAVETVWDRVIRATGRSAA